MATKNIEIQDSTGNIYYPHTDASIVKFGNSNVNATLSDLVKNISNDVILTPAMNYGMNNKITNTGEITNTPSFKIQGKTVVNLLGKDGNCEDVSKWGDYQCTHSLDTSNKVFSNNSIKIILTSTLGNIYNITLQGKLDVTKYYFISAYIKNGNASNVKLTKQGISGGSNISSSLITDTTKFNRVGIVVKPSDFGTTDVISIMLQGTSGQYAYVDGIMINEITDSEYVLGANALLANYPYVDSYTCLQNPYIEVRHDNLVRNGNGEEGTAWWEIDSTMNLSIVNGKFQLKTTVASSSAHQDIKVKPNTNYYLSGNTSGNTGLVVYNGGLSLLRNGVGTFNSGNYDFIRLYANNVNIGTGTFDSIMLVEGTTAPSSYKSCRIERTVLETKLTSDDSITYNNGKVTGQIWWKHKTLYGKDYDWQFNADYTGVKNIKLDGAIDGMNNIIGNNIPVKYTGDILKVGNSSYANVAEMYFDTGSTTRLKFGIADSDSGWTETINPNNDEVKAFMNGWKAMAPDGSRYVAWMSIVDGNIPPIMPYTTVATAYTANSTTLVVSNASNFLAGDALLLSNKGFATISSISGNTITLTRVCGANVSVGEAVYRVDKSNGTDTRMLNYCINNIAPGYEGYQLHYKLQNPEPITDDNCHIHGDIPLFDVGDNYLYLDSGMVLGEIANPVVLGNVWLNDYDIRSTSYSAPSIFKNKDETIYSIYKNGLYDMDKWSNSISSTTYGKLSLVTSQANFDTNAVYTVDYKILATQAPQIGIISCSYSQDIYSAISNIQESLNNKQAHDSILDQIVDLSLYETFDQVRAYDWHQTTGGLYIYLVVNMFPKKVMPTVSFSKYNIIYYNGSSMISSNTIASIAYVGYKYSDRQIMIGLRITDSTAINNMKTYGFEAVVNNVVVDCRGRI